MLGPPSEPAHAAVQRAAAYLRDRVGADGSIPTQPVLDYPVYSAALAVIVLNRLAIDSPQDREANLVARDAWVAYLKEFQLTERLGWQRDDAAFGGWGYSVQPPHRPAQDRPPFDADLSSTLFAVGALRLSGLGPDERPIQDALRFVERCQNFAEGAERDPNYDDGGFFFTPTNAAQNKAGVAGTGSRGVIRYHSYGTATADGLRALLRCGLPPEHPRVVAARAWLERRFATETNPGVFEPALAADRDAAWHYWCWSASHALRVLGVSTIEQDRAHVAWAAPLAEALLARQRADGSWVNPFSFMKEDDPLIATALAAAALANCRDAMGPAE
jgi:squalene-hopene/tetraprenyl-beta-curcumene cyclase